MVQKTSPFIEAKYGWNLGESGWNSGMDENLEKFSYLFDSNIDGIVSTLPAAVNGKAYFNTTDSRLYYAIDGAYSSVPVPKNYIVKLRATGEQYIYDGSALVSIGTPVDNKTKLDSLGTAAYEAREFFAYRSELQTFPLQVETVAQLRTTAGRFNGDAANVKNYLAGDGKGAKIPAEWVVVTPPSVLPADDGGMIIRVTGNTTGYWRRKLNSRGMVDGEVYGLPVGPLVDSYDKEAAIDAYCRANKINAFLGKGPIGASPVYETFNRSHPFSGPRDPGFAAVDFGYELWSEPGVVFQTTSSAGADVFNLCSMKNWGLRGFPTIRGFLTSLTGSGSNAVSMIFGVSNITIEAVVENMPTIWKPDGGTDGGHGFTIQLAGGTINPVENITFRGKVTGCTSGVNVDAGLTQSITYPYSNITIDVVAEGCYYGFVAGGTTPESSIVNPRSPQPNLSINGRMFIKNCQRSVAAIRLFGGNLNFEVYNNKNKEDLIRNPNSTSVYVANIFGVKYTNISINSRTLSLDSVLGCGAISMGGNAFPAVEHSTLDISARYTTATTEFDAGLVGTPPLRKSVVKLDGFVSIPDRFISESQSSDVIVNGTKAIPTIYPGNATVQVSGGSLSQVVYDVDLTTNRTALAPDEANKGDQIVLIRLPTSAGAGNAIGPDGSTVVTTNSRGYYIYNGTAWIRTP